MGAKHDERGKMAEATARAATIKRYGEALGDLALAEEWVQTSSAAVDVDVDATSTDDDVDVVVIASPNFTHREVVAVAAYWIWEDADSLEYQIRVVTACLVR